MKIKSIELRNIQAHRKLEIIPSSLHAIVGPSDVGKSAIVRSIRWLFTGKPNWKCLLRHGKKLMRVKLAFDNGISISRSRGEGENVCVMTSSNGTERYQSFGDSLPKPVLDAIGLTVIEHGTSITEANFQKQHDRPIFVDMSDRERMEFMNAVAGVDILDDALAILNKEFLLASRSESSIENSVSTLESKMTDAISARDKLSSAVEKARGMVKTCEKLLEKHSAISSALSEYLSAKSRFDEAREELKSMDGVDRTIAKFSEAEGSMERMELLHAATSDYDEAMELCESTRVLIHKRRKMMKECEDALNAELKRLGKCPLCGGKKK